jgi:phenylacetate-coenzyme A ligase PaaK-like adenylate-forming protein
MIDLSPWHLLEPYSLPRDAKSAMLTRGLIELTAHHEAQCPEYAAMLAAQGFRPELVRFPEDIPFLPVRLFKQLDLLSVPRHDVIKTMTSSGTSGQTPSRIHLDRATSADQTKALARIVMTVLQGGSRMPMIVVDSPTVIKDRALFSARGAGILGFSIFGRDRIFALNDQMELDVEGLTHFLLKYEGSPILIFGFTFMVWQHLCKALMAIGKKLNLNNSVLIHGGGWKTLINESVSAADFRESLQSVCGITRIHDYYGMVEQTGSIYVECEKGYLHASIYSDIVIRRVSDFSSADIDETGIIEVISILPGSYPGHALLTEDEGVILGEDDCACGRMGKYFRVLGRIKSAEPRGCSDTYATSTVSSENNRHHEG